LNDFRDFASKFSEALNHSKPLSLSPDDPEIHFAPPWVLLMASGMELALRGKVSAIGRANPPQAASESKTIRKTATALSN
jgi:hypothetical protein